MISPSIRAVTYMRMSSNEQDDSISQQTGELKKLAHSIGARIVRDYVDEGHSGDDEYRPQFNRLMHDVEKNCDFDLILVWDLDRFSRSNPMEVMSQLNVLRKASVNIHSVTQGLRDLETANLADLILIICGSSNNHEYLTKLSKGTCRGTLNTFRQKKWCGGKAPYGFKIVNETLEVESEEKLKVVKWIFHALVNLRMYSSQIARELNRQGVPSPRGKIWRQCTVSDILRREIYCGARQLAKRHSGKHFRLVGGEYKEVSRDDLNSMKMRRKRIANKRQWEASQGIVRRSKPHIVSNLTSDIDYAQYDPDFISIRVVSPTTFQAAQVRLTEIESERVKKNDPRSLPMSGLLVCGECGGPLCTHTTKQIQTRADGSKKHYNYERYRCSGGKHASYSVDAEMLHKMVIEHVIAKVLSPEMENRLVQKWITKANSKSGKLTDEKTLKKQIAALASKIQKSKEDAVEAPKQLWGALAAKIAKMEEELHNLKIAVEAQKELKGAADLGVKERERLVREFFSSLRTDLCSPDLETMRLTFQRLVSQITLHFRPIPGIKRNLTELSGGQIVLNDLIPNGLHQSQNHQVVMKPIAFRIDGGVFVISS